MKNPQTSTAFKAVSAVAGALMLGATAVSAQVVNYVPGDLLLGFHATGGQGANTTFVYNLGATVEFRDNNSVGSLGSVGSQLSSIYGANWFDRSDLFWGAVGVRNNQDPAPALGTIPPVVAGDPSATIYLSGAATGINTAIPPTGYSKSSLVSAATSIRGFTDLSSQVSGTFSQQMAVAGTDGKGAMVEASVENSWASKNPQPGPAFGIFTGGIEGHFGTGTSGGSAYIDVFRVLADSTGANPTGPVGTGTWVTTISISSSGALTAVPEPATFALLAALATLAAVGIRRLRARPMHHS